MTDLVKIRILVMRPGKQNEIIKHEIPEKPKYMHLRNIVMPLLDGADLEHVNVLADLSFADGNKYVPADMFVDERGALKGLPRNEAATIIYRRATVLGKTQVEYNGNPESLPAIYGPAILFERKVWN